MPYALKIGLVPSEPFLSWFIDLRNRSYYSFQHPTKPHHELTGGVSGWSRRQLPEREAVKRTFDAGAFALWCGLEKREYDTLTNYARRGAATVNIEIVDRVLTALGRAELLNLWYPIEFFDENGRWLGHRDCGS